MPTVFKSVLSPQFGICRSARVAADRTEVAVAAAVVVEAAVEAGQAEQTAARVHRSL